jgi:hypothetical protein
LSDPEQTLQAVEGMTPVMKTKEKAEAEENANKEPTEETKKEFEGQLTQLEATFKLHEVKNFLSKLSSSLILFERLIYTSTNLRMTRILINHFYVYHWKQSSQLQPLKHSI